MIAENVDKEGIDRANKIRGQLGSCMAGNGTEIPKNVSDDFKQLVYDSGLVNPEGFIQQVESIVKGQCNKKDLQKYLEKREALITARNWAKRRENNAAFERDVADLKKIRKRVCLEVIQTSFKMQMTANEVIATDKMTTRVDQRCWDMIVQLNYLMDYMDYEGRSRPK